MYNYTRIKSLAYFFKVQQETVDEESRLLCCGIRLN